MKSLVILGIATIALNFSFVSCKDDDTVGGEQSSLGDIGNTFSIGYTTPGVVQGASAQVIGLDGGISEVRASGTIIDDDLKDIAEELNDLYGDYYSDIATYNPSTGQATANVDLKFTNEGIAVYDIDGNQRTLVKFDAKVGDKYSFEEPNFGKVDAVVTKVSTEDDFEYKGGPYMYIKTVSMEGTASNFPYAKKIVYEANHKFGIVYAKAYLQDGSTYETYIYSQNINE